MIKLPAKPQTGLSNQNSYFLPPKSGDLLADAAAISFGSNDFRWIGFVTEPEMVFFSAAIDAAGLFPAAAFRAAATGLIVADEPDIDAAAADGDAIFGGDVMVDAATPDNRARSM